jgi:hypothetical protein
MRRNPERTNKLHQRVTLLGTIANGSTAGARKLLKKYKMPDAVNHEDLEYKLTQLYHKQDDKIELEKDLAMIHPHKDFILKYSQTTKEEPIIMEAPLETTKQEISESTSCACGCGSSGFDASKKYASGYSNATGDASVSSPMGTNTGIIVIGVVGIISILALTLNRQ